MFENKTVVVTGAGAGIGRAIACGFAQSGANVAIIDRDETSLLDTKALVRKFGRTVQTYALDLSEGHAIAGTIDRIGTDFGRIDILVNNAGLGRSRSPYELTLEDWDYVLNTNLMTKKMIYAED